MIFWAWSVKSDVSHGNPFRIFCEADRAIGILDWELSTLGNQMCDVAYSCLYYIVDIALDEVQDNGGLELTEIPNGVPSLAEYLAYYCSTAGKPWSVARWKFYVTFSLFRGASIDAGIHCRWIMVSQLSSLLLEVMLQEDTKLHGHLFKETVLPEHPPSGVYATKWKKSKRSYLFKWRQINSKSEVDNEFYELAQSTEQWIVHPKEEKLKELAKREGPWNLWIPFDSATRVDKIISGGTINKAFEGLLGAGLSNLEYGYFYEIMGHSVLAPKVFNCGAPDTENMEVFMRYGNEEQLHQWLVPLLEGNIRSGFAMTEPQVASSDATNIEFSIRRLGESYIINGRKWWTSGAMDHRCKVLIVMGKTDFNAPKHKQQSLILVDINTSGVNIKQPLTVSGFDDAPYGHSEISFENVYVPAKNILLGEGRGFEIAQGMLGPGRLHHCM
ncbi:probable acyl- dehydrogenase IBR3 [Olea europaea subsp. europaea]|uniref:Probable acyl- dehydrogenase IBR3 n=1 Tax=Olea europaea subsp. europaea TaxID=158383 RepID=A0A8S0SZS8_OLEEU|nr:probable acyl- dehydrogenase IBR3 [Olea europaea subsp. europaea]